MSGKLTKAQRTTLQWLAENEPVGWFPRGGPGTQLMARRLVKMGLAKTIHPDGGFGLILYAVTEAGRTALEKNNGDTKTLVVAHRYRCHRDDGNEWVPVPTPGILDYLLSRPDVYTVEPLVPASALASHEARIAELEGALRDTTCPRPCNNRPDDFTVGQCVDAGECGCSTGAALHTEGE